jgi:hypothetical protein
MRQRFLIAAAILAAWSSCGPLGAQQNNLMSEAEAARHGLARPGSPMWNSIRAAAGSKR